MKQKLSNGMGARLRKVRKELGLTREAFAEQIDITPNFLAEVETDKKGLSTLAICKVCERASISADYLLLGREGKSDCGVVVEMLRNLEPQYVALAEEMLRAFVFAVGRSKATEGNSQ